ELDAVRVQRGCARSARLGKYTLFRLQAALALRGCHCFLTGILFGARFGSLAWRERRFSALSMVEVDRKTAQQQRHARQPEPEPGARAPDAEGSRVGGIRAV